VLGLSAQQGAPRTPAPVSTAPYEVWSASQLSTPGQLGNFGNHNASIQRRIVGSPPEVHDGFSHFLMFTSGEGTFVLGGKIVDGPDGKKIVTGGESRPIVLGAMYHVAVNTVHWVVPKAGTTVTYWVTNINLDSAAAHAQALPPLPPAPPAAAAPPRTPPLIMTTSAFEDGGIIPVKYTMASASPAVSPDFKWTQVPPGTQSFVLLMHDAEGFMDKGPKMDATHWVVWNIPVTATGLPENLPAGELADGTRQVGYRANAYLGPGAGPGPYHHYTFDLYALDTKLDIAQGPPEKLIDLRLAVFAAMEGHVLGKAVIIGRFHR